jgi:phospholipid/cholesterol/gamma-HCH transport system permease protein
MYIDAMTARWVAEICARLLTMTEIRVSHNRAGESSPAFSIEPRATEPTHVELRLQGSLAFTDAEVIWSRLRGHVDAAPHGSTMSFEMSAVQHVDGGVMALLAHLRAELQQRGVKSEFLGASDPIQEIIHLYRGDIRVGRRKRRKPLGTLDQLGRATVDVLYEVKHVLTFLGEMLVAGIGIVRSPRSANWRELTPTMERSGADAVPIVVLVNFLVGIVMAFQASVQLKQFGASIFVADLIGISVTRELGPLMTAIVICGRSGAAFAAELGSMRVNEEVDALRTMGLGPLRFLVLPRALALMLVMPILTLLADLVGILGGLVVGLTSLDLTVSAYVGELQKAVKPWDVYSGLLKSMIFALAIALIACQQGLATTGGAEGVGRRTTSAVVTALFTLILLDAAFTATLRVFDL